MSARQKENVTKYVIMAIVSLLVLFPYYWMVCTSLKTPSKIFVTPPQWWPDPVKWANYTDLFTRSHLGTYLWNSFKDLWHGRRVRHFYDAPVLHHRAG